MKSLKLSFAVGLLALVSTFAAASVSAALPEIEVKTSIRISSVTREGGRVTERERDTDFRNSLFFTKSDSYYSYSLDFFMSEKGLRGRLCKLTQAGQLVDCFAIRKASAFDGAACLISPYDEQRDVPKLKRGYTERDLERAFDYAGLRAESARTQLSRVNLALAGKASAVRFKPFTVEYQAGRAVVLKQPADELAYLHARGEVACKRLYEVVLPDLRSL